MCGQQALYQLNNFTSSLNSDFEQATELTSDARLSHQLRAFKCARALPCIALWSLHLFLDILEAGDGLSFRKHSLGSELKNTLHLCGFSLCVASSFSWALIWHKVFGMLREAHFHWVLLVVLNQMRSNVNVYWGFYQKCPSTVSSGTPCPSFSRSYNSPLDYKTSYRITYLNINTTFKGS